MKLLVNGDRRRVSGSPNASEPPSRSTTVLMKSPQIEAGKVPPATVIPWTLVIERRTPSLLGYPTQTAVE